MKSIFKKYTLVQIFVGIIIFHAVGPIVGSFAYIKGLPALFALHAETSSKLAVLRDRVSRGCTSP